ncbi:DNA recombination-dependent growth factor C [Janthinobacterium psychrotolerans]|uniref:Recombination-associated protein RdgC n=2 Tax=Janthinobacterium psychrotolerans TaxID=1747903 RepID=A0A1A7BWZ0_9BURK|nr:DNA recombination-dependent growth factor C [Janthinobacterium psychrotolerans]
MFFKNIQAYRLPQNWPMTADALAEALAPQKFTDATSMDMVSQGWAPPRGAGQQLVHAVAGQFLLQLKTEKKLLPSTVINQVAAARALEMEEAQGFAPGKKAMKELKERVTDELLPRAFAILSTTAVWIDSVNGWLVVDAASPAKADEVVKLLLKSVDKLPLEGLRVQRSPVGAMTEWLQADESPAGFTVDQDAIMRATGESKAQVAYKRHTLEADDIRRHIAAGKQCTRLAMTWNDKISFVLDESLAIKSIKPLEIIKESATRNDDERFDSDMALMTGELAKMLADLVEALGGEARLDAPAPVPHPAAGCQTKTERAVGLTAELYQVRARHRDVLNELYQETIQPVIAQVREQMSQTGEGAIAAALALAKALPSGSSSAPLFLVAAVEIMEPSAPAAGDEPVRQQRPVLQLNGEAAGAVPAGDGSASDPLYEQAVKVVRAQQRASVSLVQRTLKTGYNRAQRLIEAMAAAGVIKGTQGIYTVAAVAGAAA